MRHLFLINPTAGKEDCTPRITAQAKALAEQLGEEYEIFVDIPTCISHITNITTAIGHPIAVVVLYA